METPSQDWLPPLLRDIAPKVLWEFLSPKPKSPDFDPARLQARAMVLQGFQATPANLRHPTVQRRLLDWFSRHPDAALALQKRREELRPAPEPEVESLPVEVEPEPQEPTLEEWRERALKSEAEVERKARLEAQQSAELETSRERLRAAAKDSERLKKEERQKSLAAQKKLEQAQQTAQKELAELRKHDERETRRLHAAERARDEFETTIRVLKKQVRHLNQLLDSEQKKAASLEARLKQGEPKADNMDAVSTPPTTQEKDKPVKVARPTPLDELFRWVADGHEFRATPRQVMKHIEANDEEFAFRAQLALEGISAQDTSKKNALLHRLREQDGYYVRVLIESTQRALVDASNVARSTKNKRGKGELRNLIEMKRELRRLGFFPIEFIADASLRYNIDDINAYNEMINRGEVEVVNAGTEADEVLVRRARGDGGYVVTNDAKFHFKVSPDFAPPSIGFRVVAGTIIVDEF